jgi:hypothetical protein
VTLILTVKKSLSMAVIMGLRRWWGEVLERAPEEGKEMMQ